MSPDPPRKSATVPPGVWRLSLLGFGFGAAVGVSLCLSGGLYLAFAGATSFGLYGALLGFAAGAVRRAPAWGALGAILGSIPMVLLVYSVYLEGEANGSNIQGDAGIWVAWGILVSIPAALGGISGAFFGIARKART
jgi:hypothetical protein